MFYIVLTIFFIILVANAGDSSNSSGGPRDGYSDGYHGYYDNPDGGSDYDDEYDRGMMDADYDNEHFD